MEEWVGAQWHRFIQKAASKQHAHAAVHLPDVQRTIGMLFRAGGGAHAVRVAPATDVRAGGPRDWLQRIAGSGTHASTGRMEPEALSLPSTVAVFDDHALNRALYLWLAAMAAVIEPTGDWVMDNVRATAAAQQRFPGLGQRYAALRAAQQALRPDASRLKGRAAQAEVLVQLALAGEPVAAGSGLLPGDVAPVWLWLDVGAGPAAAPSRGDPEKAEGATRKPSVSDARRRKAQAVSDDRDKAPLMMFFRAESVLSWGEFIKVNRATDDDPDENASNVANDMDMLAIAPDGQSAASRVKFDLDLPSAAADDRPLGPGQRFPEWDFRRNALLPDHCALQTFLARPSEAYQPPAALKATAKRVRRRLEILRAGTGRARGQSEGDDIDLDAWVRHRVDALSSPTSEAPPVFTRRVRTERSLATLLLADLSLSTDAYATQTARVIDVIRDALYVFGEALAASGDPFEMLGFSSVRRHNVRIQHLKGFNEPWNVAARDRVGAIKPGYYTRMGAAVRLATERLIARPERQRLMLILTDGKPNDLDVYEGRYGLEDTRHAVQAARAAGLIPFCITIDESAHDYLPMLFGQQGYALVHRPQDLVSRLAAVYMRFMRQSGA
ncbi:VWA domain-containing protein [Hydrogenophaga crassostreae]|uniref:VWA domain-containing protein n=1 Tax=Hydrogenophaga crassostreae TaxID=1763535 RepID=A0A162T5J4_9BURK|nr:VWA domain-containing protein [Hydrogenophaga crassostreae]AOW14313.1 VWA domain-containing protein [Hydrogenophaga crassostreae]OAD43665.1 VWA domain-containing protein [Hydrogenophaga crassostreae]